MALKRYVHSVVLAQEGVREDVDSWVAAGGKGVELADVEIDRPGRFRKRWGVQSFTSSATAPPDPLAASLDYGLNMASCQGELLSYTGKALYGYSPTAAKWAFRGELGSVMTERLASIRDTSGQVRSCDVCVSGGYVVAGYAKKENNSSVYDVFASVYDEDNGSIVMSERRVATATNAGHDGLVTLACSTDTVGIVYSETGNALKYVYSTTGTEFASWTTVSLATLVVGGFDAVSMGASGFAYAFYESAGNTIRIRVCDETGGQLVVQTVAYVGTVRALSLHWDGTNLHLVYYSDGDLKYILYNAALALQSSGVVKSTATTINPKCAVTYNADTGNAFVMWHETATSASVTTHTTTVLRYREVVASTGVVTGSENKTHGHYLVSRPVVENGQYHFIVSSDLCDTPSFTGYPAIRDPDGDGNNQNSGYNYDGLFMLRYEPRMLTDTSGAPVTVSAFALGSGFGANIGVQYPPLNLHAGATGGTFFSAASVAVSEFQGDSAIHQADVFKHTRDPAGAGKVLNHHGGGLILGGVPSFYDGMSAYNLATLVKPTILSLTAATSGSLTVLGTYGVILVEEFLDAQGNVVLSQASDACSKTLTGADDEIKVGYRTSTIENKRDAWLLDSAYAQRRVSIYRTENGGTTYYYEDSQVVNKYATDWGLFSITLADTTVRNRAQPYIYGGELSNNPLPSCHVGCISSGRAHVRSDENKRKVFYSKPSIPGRTVEFDLVQSYNMFPEDVVGMADMSGSPVAVSKGHVYVVDGIGPGLAGLPANAFSVREVAAVGTTDQESVIAVPGGVIFRGPDTFYLAGQNGLEPIGDKVQDAAGSYPTTLRSELDPQTRSARWLVTNDDGATRVLVYYWDIKQWVVHTPDISGGSLSTFCHHDGAFYYANDNGSYGVADGSAFTDGAVPLGGGGSYAGRIKLGWEHVEGIQGRKRFWEVDLLIRRRAAHALEVTLWYGRDESDSDVFYFSAGDITAMGSLEKVRVQVPHGRGVTDAIQVQVRDVEQTTAIPEVVTPFVPEYLPGSTQGFELVAVDYIVGLDSGAVKLSAARTA